jgi:hypothetical protein
MVRLSEKTISYSLGILYGIECAKPRLLEEDVMREHRLLVISLFQFSHCCFFFAVNCKFLRMFNRAFVNVCENVTFLVLGCSDITGSSCRHLKIIHTTQHVCHVPLFLHIYTSVSRVEVG